MYPYQSLVVVPYYPVSPSLPKQPTYRLLKRVEPPKEPELVNVSLPPLTAKEDKAIRDVLQGPTNMQLACCSFSFPINLGKVFLELETFAKTKLNISHLSLEFCDRTVWQVLGTNYMVRFLNQQNRPIAAPIRSLERNPLFLHVRVCNPANAVGSNSLLKNEFMRIVGRHMPPFNLQQIGELNIFLTKYGFPSLRYSYSPDLHMSLAETFMISPDGSFDIDFVTLPRTEEQSRFYLPFSQYLTPAEEEKFVPAAPPLKFTATGLRVFCDTIYHYLAPPTVVVRKTAAQKRLATHLHDSAHARPQQTQSVESQQRLLQKLKGKLIQQMLETDCAKRATFKVITATIFGALPPLREGGFSQGMAQYWLEILTSSDTLGDFALEWAAGLQKRGPTHKQFIGKLFIGFFKQPNKKRLTASFYELLDEKQAILELANILNDHSYRDNLHGLLAELTAKEGAARTFLSELTEQLQGKNPQLIGDAWAFLCGWLQNQGKVKRATKIWVEAVQRGVWIHQSDRQVELFASLSDKIEGKKAEEFLKAVAKLPVAFAQNQQFQAAYARLKDKCESENSHSHQDPPCKTEYKHKIAALVLQLKQHSQGLQSFLDDAQRLITEFQEKPFFVQNPLEFLGITSKLLFHASFDKAFFRTYRGEQWHVLLFSVMRKASQGSPKGIEVCCRFFNGVLEHLVASKATENLSKNTLQTYHDFLHELLSCRHAPETPQEASQSLLVDNLMSCIAPLLVAYERQGLYEEGYQLLFDLHIHKNVFVAETPAILSCLGLFAGKLQALPEGSPAIFEVERLLKQMPFLLRPSPFFEIQEKQKEVGFLLAQRFLPHNPEKSWQLFQGVLNCYPALLSEPKFEKEGTIFAEQLYKKLGFPVVDFLLKFFTEGKGIKVPLEPDWGDKFVAKILQRMLEKGCLEDLYRILSKYSSSSYSQQLTPVAAAWVKKALVLPDSQVLALQMLATLRQYDVDEPELWWRVFEAVRGSRGVDLWLELQDAERRNRLQADPVARRECWEIVCLELRGRQILFLVEYTETILELFSQKPIFLIAFIEVIFEHLANEPIEVKIQHQGTLKAFCSKVLEFVALTNYQRERLKFYAMQIDCVHDTHASLTLFLNLVFADNDVSKKMKAIGTEFEMFLHHLASSLVCLANLKNEESGVLSMRIQLQNKLREMLFSAFDRAKTLPPDQLMELVVQIQILWRLEHNNACMPLYRQYWKALVIACQKLAEQNNLNVIDGKCKKRFFAVFTKSYETQPPQFFQVQGELLKNENALFVFTPPERADLLALASSSELSMVVDDLTRFDELVAERLPIVLRDATIEKKDQFLALVFTGYATIAVKKKDRELFFGRVDKVKSLVSIGPTEEEKEGNRKAELEIEKCALKFVLINYSTVFKETTQVSTEFLESASIRFEHVVQNIKPDEDKDLLGIIKMLLCHKAAIGPDQAKSVKNYLQRLQQRYALFSKKELFDWYFYLKRLDRTIKIPVEEFSDKEILVAIAPTICEYLQDGNDLVNHRLKYCVELVMDCQAAMLGELQKESAAVLPKNEVVLGNIYEMFFLFENKHRSHFVATQGLITKHFFYSLKKLFEHIDSLFSDRSADQKKSLATFVVNLSINFFNWYSNGIINRRSGDPSASIAFQKDFVTHVETLLTTYVLKYGCYVDNQAPLRHKIRDWLGVLFDIGRVEAMSAVNAIKKRAKELNFNFEGQYVYSGLKKNHRMKMHLERKK